MTNGIAFLGLLTALTAVGFTLTERETARPTQEPTHGLEFVAAAMRGDENAVRKALEEDPELAMAIDDRGMTALDWAATREHWHIFRQLLDKGAPVDRIGADGGTVLHRVAHHDRADMMQLLIDAGGDLSAQNQWGRSPLHVAARRGCGDVARLLIDLGADLHAETNEGWTPLHVAYRAGQPDLVEIFLAAGADPNRTDGEGTVPSANRLERPSEVTSDAASLHDYQGLFDVDENFFFKVWVEDSTLFLRDFGTDELYATGGDTFFCKSEPWSVSFERDADGAVNGVTVQFLRRSVRGIKRDAPMYVGAGACRSCHIRQEHGAQYVPWVSSRHGAAYWRLATEWSLLLARSRPHFPDMHNPLEDERCLLCHVTGAQDADALFASSFDETQGIGCESCHGPGSEYMAPAVMADREAFLSAGGRIPDEDTCVSCHRNPARFDFSEWWPRITHGGSGQ